MMPILDDHMHLQFQGYNVDAVKEFLRLGGTHLIMSHMPYSDMPLKNLDDFRAQYERSLSMVEKIRAETDARIFLTAGPYPADLLRLEETNSLKKAEEIMMDAMDLAAEWVRDGKAIAIGEVGRPHFEVKPEEWEASNRILIHGMELAKETGCAIVLHTEKATPEGWKELASFADRAGIERGRVVKHFSPPAILPEENQGLFPSVLASKENIKKALKKGDRFTMETDYIDDPERPGAVLSLKTVPRRTKAFLENGLMSEEQAWKIHKENPEKVYGMEIEV